jgi:transcriptional regulator with XRE-family HTH domain
MSEVRPPTTAREAALAAVAAEVHERRTALSLSVRTAAKRCAVSPTVIFEVENRQRVPSLVTYEKLREGLGLAAPATALIHPGPAPASSRTTSQRSPPASSSSAAPPSPP